MKKCYKATAKTKASISQTHSENSVKAICDVKSVLKRAITLNPLATMFPKETRQQVARVISDRELENIKQGEYDAPKGTVS